LQPETNLGPVVYESETKDSIIYGVSCLCDSKYPLEIDIEIPKFFNHKKLFDSKITCKGCLITLSYPFGLNQFRKISFLKRTAIALRVLLGR
jgi:hypothetical protein